MRARMALRGTGVVGAGTALLLISPLFEWVETPASADASAGGGAVLVLHFALGALVLAVIAAARSAAWPFVYIRVLGVCALVTVIWAVLHEGGTAEFGALVAGLGAAMIASGSSAALSSEAVLERRGPR